MSLHSSPPPALVDAVTRGQRFYVTSHQRPDGDAIGSAVGMALALRAMGKQATVVMDAVPPAFLQPFPDVDGIRVAASVGAHTRRLALAAQPGPGAESASPTSASACHAKSAANASVALRQ